MPPKKVVPKPKVKNRQPRRPATSDNGGWTALTPERQVAIVANIGKGVHIEIAARAAGVSYETFRRWMAQGDDKIETDEVTGVRTVMAAPEPYRGFRVAIEDAEAALELDLVDRYRVVSRQASFGNATYLAGFLGRRFKPRWDPKTSVEVSGPGGAPIEVKGDVADTVAGVLGALARAGVVALPGDAPADGEGADPEAD